MKKNLFRIFLCMLAISISPLMDLHGQTVIRFQNRENSQKTRQLKFKGYQYLKIKTIDSTYNMGDIVDITDSAIVAQNKSGTFLIPISKIKSIRKKFSNLEGLGRLVLGLSSVGIAVGVPVIWIEDGAGKIGEKIIGTVIIAACSVPMIFISKWTTQINMKRWRIDSFSKTAIN